MPIGGKTILFLQDQHGNEIYEGRIDGNAPLVLMFEGEYFYRRGLRKMGDAVYRPASFYYLTRGLDGKP